MNQNLENVTQAAYALATAPFILFLFALAVFACAVIWRSDK